jgi:glycine/D-amino acid oxidase-like deaminating enzyme/nitrite reductase/ring-hydroxylating ferredoxin subunit
VEADVAVVGGGITGLSGAYELAKSGRTVVVLERDTLGGAETGRTTGFLTAVLDARLADLVSVHGEVVARAAWESSAKGIDLVVANIATASIECDFRRVDAYLYGPRARDRPILEREARLAREFGFPVDLVDPEEIPFPCSSVLRIPGQARLHPRKYLLGLAKGILAGGGQVHEWTNVVKLEICRTGPRRVAVRTPDHHATVFADSVLLASNAPFTDRRRVYSRLRACRSYAMASPIPRGRVPEGLFWNTLDPYDYARLDAGPNDDFFLLGGADHDVGRPGRPQIARRHVRAYWRKVIGPAPTDPLCWSGEILNSEDGLPFIGPNPGSPAGESIGTGFGGNGLTLGAIAGWMFSERVLGRSTEWDALFDPGRKKRATAGTGLFRNPPAPTTATTRTVRTPRDLAVGQGAWYDHRGRRIGLFRASLDDFRGIDARCTHRGCFVEWNPVESSWDCPCHGSRFDANGAALDGPAFRPLKSIPIPSGPISKGTARTRRAVH